MPQPTAEPDLAGGLVDFAVDVISLAELQTQLLIVDVNECRSRLMLSISLLVAAPVGFLAALPLLLFSVSTLLAGHFEVSVESMQAAVGGGVFVIAGVIGWLGWRQFTASLGTLSRSRAELKENLAWLKSALKNQRQPYGFRSANAGKHSPRYPSGL